MMSTFTDQTAISAGSHPAAALLDAFGAAALLDELGAAAVHGVRGAVPRARLYGANAINPPLAGGMSVR